MARTPEQLNTTNSAHALVAFLQSHDLEAPTELTEVLAMHQTALEYLNEPSTQSLDALYNANPKTITKAIDALVDNQTRAGARQVVQAEVEQAMHRRVLGAVNRCSPPILDSLVDTFDAAAERFTTA